MTTTHLSSHLITCTPEALCAGCQARFQAHLGWCSECNGTSHRDY